MLPVTAIGQEKDSVIPHLPIWILLIIALGVIVGWKVIRFTIKILILVILLLFIIGFIYFLPYLLEYCPLCD